MGYFCKNCEVEILDIAKAMMKGCDCGSRIFKQNRNFKGHPRVEEVAKEINQMPNNHQLRANGDVAILIKGKGTYSVNIDALVNRASGIEPLLIEDAKGIINVILNPDP